MHNNPAELGARSAVRRRDISLHTMTPEGTEANDCFMTLAQTAKKQDISKFDYFYDRLTQSFQMPSLAQMIEQKTTKPTGKQELKKDGESLIIPGWITIYIMMMILLVVGFGLLVFILS